MQTNSFKNYFIGLILTDGISHEPLKNNQNDYGIPVLEEQYYSVNRKYFKLYYRECMQTIRNEPEIQIFGQSYPDLVVLGIIDIDLLMIKLSVLLQ